MDATQQSSSGAAALSPSPVAVSASPGPSGESLSAEQLMRFEAQKKSAGVAVVLCWLGGAFGAHRFYLRRPGTAATMLITTILAFPLSFIVIGLLPIAIIAVWVIIDLFNVSRWVREFNAGLIAKIKSGQA